MLQKLRDKTSGWIATVILGLLIIPFAFFGMESYLSQRVDGTVARVLQPPTWWHSAPRTWPLSYLWKTHTIESAEFRQRLETARMRARAEQGDAFDAKAFESPENKRALLDAMVDELLMQLAAERDGITISDAEVRASIQRIPDFQVDGQFNPERYQLVLASQNPPQTPRGFEQVVRDSLKEGLIPGRLAQSGLVTDAELDRLMRLLGERRDVSFVAVPAAPVDTAPVSAEQIDAWYKANAGKFRTPETVRLEYIEVDGSTLPAPAADEAALRKRYDDQIAKYASAEQRDMAHILLLVPADADAARKKAIEDKAKALAARARAPGADFGALAKAESEDTGSRDKGGELGWITRGGMPGAFDDAAFAMQAGEVRGPIKTDFGWHILKLKEVREGVKRPFEDVRAELERELQEGERERAFNELTGKLVDAVYKNPNSLEPAATALGLPLQSTPAFTRLGGMGIAGDQKVVRAAFSEQLLQDGTASDPIELGPERTVLIRVIDHQPERAQPLSAVREAVVAAIRADRQRKATDARADALVKAARQKGLAAAAVEAGLAAVEENDIARGAAAPSRDAVQAFFAVGRPRDNVIPVEKTGKAGQVVVFAIRAVRDGDIGQVTPQERQQLRAQLSQAYGVQSQEAFVRAARAQYRIEISEDRL